ncbi:hypothetical protein D3C78_1008660 [compost metagenome]
MTGNGLAQYLAKQMRGRDAMAAVAMRKIDIVREPAHMRDARQGQREIAAPGEVDLRLFQLREGLQHVRPDHARQIGRVAAAITDAAAIEQAIIRGAAVIIENIVGILDAIIGGQKLLDQIGIERLRRHDLA